MRRFVMAFAGVLAVAAGLAVVGAIPMGSGPPQAQAGQLRIDEELTDEQERLLSGFAAFELGRNGDAQQQNPQHPVQYFPRGSDSCPNNISSNIKVNQNCLNLTDPDLQGRAQAQNETYAKADPNDPNHIVASYNDYRRGDGTCGVSYSLDSGRTWNETTVPNNFVRGDRVNRAPRLYYQASGDTSVDWDSKGNVYLSCQMFKRGSAVAGDVDQSNGLYVFRSTQNDGASFNFPARPVTENSNTTGNFLPLADKQFMAVDHNESQCGSDTTIVRPGSSCSPFQDRIYVTWTEFAPDGTAFIYESYSADYGEHFSPRHLVSANSSLCPQAGEAGPCFANQDSQPFVGPDGTLYVVWNNYNNSVKAGDNRNQILLAKSLDGGNTFTPPVRVADFYDLPDCATYQDGHDFGRACVPEKGPTARSYFRASNYPSGEVNPTNPAEVVVTFGSYINRHSNEGNGCVPTGFDPTTGQNLYTGVKTPGACNNDILVSVSEDFGATFTGTATDPRELPSANTEPGQAVSDQFWQWIGFTKNGKLATSYYDRQYGNDEVTGESDISLSSASTPYTDWNVFRVTNSPMPVPTQFPDAGGYSTFYGDYAGLAVETQAHPVWSDTRNPDLFACPSETGEVATPPRVCGARVSETDQTQLNDQDTYTANVGVSATR